MDTVRGQPGNRGADPQEQGTAPDPGTSPQVADDGLADISRQGQPLQAASLAAHRDLAVAPVDIAELERGHLPGPQPQPVQHREDGEVPRACQRVPVTARQQGGTPAPSGRGNR